MAPEKRLIEDRVTDNLTCGGAAQDLSAGKRLDQPREAVAHAVNGWIAEREDERRRGDAIGGLELSRRQSRLQAKGFDFTTRVSMPSCSDRRRT